MISALVVSSLAIAGGDIAPVVEEVEASPVVVEDSGLQQRILIYGWLPSLSGTLKYELPPGSGGDVNVDISTLIDALKMVFMGIYEIRKDKWSFTADAIYLNLGKSDSKAATIPGEPGELPFEVGHINR